MDVHFEFREYEMLDEMVTFGGWIGKYTIGDINVRGTRLWFRPPYVKSYDIEGISLENELLEGKTTFPGDYCNIRGDSLQEILSELKGENDDPRFKYYQGTLKKFLNENRFKYFILNNPELKNETFQYDEILTDIDYELSNVWLITHKEEIIAELEYVLEKCEEEGVLWTWV